MKRRGFLMGLGAALAMPAIVKAEVLMPVRKVILPEAPAVLFGDSFTMGVGGHTSLQVSERFMMALSDARGIAMGVTNSGLLLWEGKNDHREA